ncbi:MAG: aldo/keto reductase [Solirubrobacteraceae bacterium]
MPQTPLEQTLEVIASYRERGEIRHVGLTEVGVEQIERAWRVVPVAAVQTHYNRDERRTRRSSTTVPRRGSLRPLLPAARAGPPAVAEIAARHGANTTQIALAWLLRLSPTMLPIPSALSLRTYGPTSQELQLGAGRPALLVNGYPRPRRTGTRCFPPGSQVTGDGSFAGGNAILTARLTATSPRPSLGRAGDGRVVSRAPATTRIRRGAAGALTLGVGLSFAQLLPDGTPNESSGGGLEHRRAPAGRPQRGRAARPGRHIAALAGFVENVGNPLRQPLAAAPSRWAGQKRQAR